MYFIFIFCKRKKNVTWVMLSSRWRQRWWGWRCDAKTKDPAKHECLVKAFYCFLRKIHMDENVDGNQTNEANIYKTHPKIKQPLGKRKMLETCSTKYQRGRRYDFVMPSAFSHVPILVLLLEAFFVYLIRELKISEAQRYSYISFNIREAVICI